MWAALRGLSLFPVISPILTEACSALHLLQRPREPCDVISDLEDIFRKSYMFEVTREDTIWTEKLRNR